MKKRAKKRTTKKRRFKGIISTLALAKKHQTAYKKLPSAYRNDDALSFSYEHGSLVARPKVSERPIIGDWKSEFKKGKWRPT